MDPEQHFRESGASKGSKWLGESDVPEIVPGFDLRRFIKLNPKETIEDEAKDAVPSMFGDDQLFLLPEWIRGFTMATHGERKWGEFYENTLLDDSSTQTCTETYCDLIPSMAARG